MQRILREEASAARRASLNDLLQLQEEKQDALDALFALGADHDPAAGSLPEVRVALRGMLAAAEENGLILASIAGALESVQDRLRTDLAAATNPGTYSVASQTRRRFSLAASIDQTA
jgi:hypothetical protein